MLNSRIITKDRKMDAAGSGDWWLLTDPSSDHRIHHTSKRGMNVTGDGNETLYQGISTSRNLSRPSYWRLREDYWRSYRLMAAYRLFVRFIWFDPSCFKTCMNVTNSFNRNLISELSGSTFNFPTSRGGRKQKEKRVPSKLWSRLKNTTFVSYSSLNVKFLPQTSFTSCNCKYNNIQGI